MQYEGKQGIPISSHGPVKVDDVRLQLDAETVSHDRSMYIALHDDGTFSGQLPPGRYNLVLSLMQPTSSPFRRITVLQNVLVTEGTTRNLTVQ